MVKVSITLPNKAQITFESEEPEVIHQIVQVALRDLPRDLMLSSLPTNGNAALQTTGEKSTSVTSALPAEANPATVESQSAPPSLVQSPAITHLEASATHSARSPDTTLTAAEQAFIQFCQSVNPLGDMRRVVVAMEGARKFLLLDSVDAEALGPLFDLAGWRHPHDFVQALRNAARSKFRWLERVSGRSGHYSVTDLGRATTLGN
jgi:hypothetical protein